MHPILPTGQELWIPDTNRMIITEVCLNRWRVNPPTIRITLEVGHMIPEGTFPPRR